MQRKLIASFGAWQAWRETQDGLDRASPGATGGEGA